MAKTRTTWLCNACGSTHPRWAGRCADCGEWDSLAKFNAPAASDSEETGHRGVVEIWTGEEGGDAPTTGATPLHQVHRADVDRTPTGIGELDRVLGGGFVPGSVILVGGDPGIGKSTLLLQAAGGLARTGCPILYVSSEESAFQTRLRAERLFGNDLPGLDALHVLADTNLARIVEQARRVRPALMVLDSIQMVYKADLEASPGSVTQLRRCCMELVYLAKASGMAVVVVGHVTKDGQLAGPKLLEHLVDAVLSFEGDRNHAHRVVRAVKNRFGTTLEVGLFEMGDAGLREVDDSARLLGADVARPGTAVAPVMQGTRCLLVEIQALTATGFPGTVKRRASGLDANRLALMVAILEQHGGVGLADQDVFAATAGGFRVIEPAADLALGLAIAGARAGRALPPGTAAIGEVGLGGELRPVARLDARLHEVARLGFRQALVPPGTTGSVRGVRTLSVASLAEGIARLEVVASSPEPARSRESAEIRAGGGAR